VTILRGRLSSAIFQTLWEFWDCGVVIDIDINIDINIDIDIDIQVCAGTVDHR
jgi:hypothetical protein